MIKDLIDRLVDSYPTEVGTFAAMVAMAAPFLLITAIVWLLAVAGQWLIEWHERRCIERARRLRYRTASQQQMERDMQQLWVRR